MSGGYLSTEFLSNMKLSSLKIDLSKYEIGDEISRGSFSTIFEVVEKETQKKFAMKIYSGECDSKEFKKDKLILSMIDHPCVLKTIGICPAPPPDNDDEEWAIVIPYYPKGTLESALKKENALTGTQKTNIIYGICSALMNMHERHVLYLDLRPAKVILDDNCEPILSCSNSMNLFECNKIFGIGTPLYMSPDVFGTDENDYTSAADVYSFAVTLYRFFTTQIQYNERKSLTTYHQMMKKIKNGDRPLRAKSIPDPFWDIITQCWNQDPKQRPTFKWLMDQFETRKELHFEGTNEEEFQQFVHKIKNAKVTNSIITITDDMLDL